MGIYQAERVKQKSGIMGIVGSSVFVYLSTLKQKPVILSKTGSFLISFMCLCFLLSSVQLYAVLYKP